MHLILNVFLSLLSLICFSECIPLQKRNDEGLCLMHPTEKEDCGYYGIKEKECVEDRGCCWYESNVPNTPWCYYAGEPTTPKPKPTPEPTPTPTPTWPEYGSGSDEEEEGCSEPFAINSLSEETPEGYRRPTKDEVDANLEKVKGCLDTHGQWAILLIEGGKMMGSGYGYSFEDNSGGAGSELLIEEQPAAEVAPTPGCADPFRIVYIETPPEMPNGWRLATENEVRNDMETVKDCVDTQGSWGILKIQDSKVMGSGYGYGIEQSEENAGWVLILPQ